MYKLSIQIHYGHKYYIEKDDKPRDRREVIDAIAFALNKHQDAREFTIEMKRV